MKIERNSRFYSFLYFLGKWSYGYSHPAYIDAKMPNTVCTLFWFVVFGIGYLIAKAVILTLGVVALMFFASGILLHTLYPLVSFQLLPNTMATSLVTMCLWTGVGIIAIALFRETEYYNDIMEQRYDEQRKRQEDESKTGILSGLLSMVVEYAKSLKDKVCPIIEYTE